MQLDIQIAGTEQIPAISFLAKTIWQQHYPPIIGQEQTDYMLQHIYSSDQLEKQMREGQLFHLLLNHQQAIGFLSTSHKGPYDYGKQEYFLNKFYILPQNQNAGIGRKAWMLWLDQHPEAGLVKLQVNRLNIRSINFYFRLGFSIEEAADFDIGNGYFMNDFVMSWKAK